MSAALSNAILKATNAPTVAASPIATADMGLFSIGRIIDRPISGIITFCEISPTLPGAMEPIIAAPDAIPSPAPTPPPLPLNLAPTFPAFTLNLSFRLPLKFPLGKAGPIGAGDTEGAGVNCAAALSLIILF